MMAIIRGALVVALMAGTLACGSTDPAEAPTGTTAAGGTAATTTSGGAGGAGLSDGGGGGGERSTKLLLRGDPSFSPDQLPSAVRTWYDRFWAAMATGTQPYGGADAMASSNDTYQYGRSLNSLITTMLAVFRRTGDLALLDEVDRLAELMRAELADWSITTIGGTEYEADGYLNWLYQYDAEYVGTDVHEMDEIHAHSLVATIAYALAANKDVPGLSAEAANRYDEHSAFWVDYLRNHFEAKWRARKQIATGPFLDKDLTHAYTHWTRYYAYMHLLTGEPWYLAEAERRADLIDALMVEVHDGAAFVWDHRMVLDSDDTTWGCQVFYYAYGTVIGVLDLSLEGIGPFDAAFLGKMAGTVTRNIVDNGIVDFAPDVCGGIAMGGLDASGYDRFEQGRWLESPFTVLAPWESGSVLVDTTVGVFEARESTPDSPTNANPPIAMTFALLPD